VVVVGEGTLRFGVDVTAPLSTGLFPDLREGRRAVERRARDRRVLNLFAYTGAISAYALRGGARAVMSVDLAAKAHARARRNLSLSAIDPESVEYVVGDVFKVLGDLRARHREFDLVVLDPPSFAQSKAGVFTTLKDYGALTAEAVRVLAPGGVLVAVANTVKLSVEEHDKALGDGASRAGADLRIIERCGLPPDFPVAPGFAEGNYLKCAIAARA
jgi:23S rRNA (cytosine1962-C5)-methyltransferase